MNACAQNKKSWPGYQQSIIWISAGLFRSQKMLAVALRGVPRKENVLESLLA